MGEAGHTVICSERIAHFDAFSVKMSFKCNSSVFVNRSHARNANARDGLRVEPLHSSEECIQEFSPFHTVTGLTSSRPPA